MWPNRWEISLFPMKTWIKIRPPILAAILLLIFLLVILLKINSSIGEQSVCILEWELLALNRANLRFPIILDKIRLRFRAVVLLISFRVILFRTSYISNEQSLQYFIIIVLIFILSINLLIFSPSIFSLLLGWDGLGLTSYLLVIFYSNDKSLAAGIITALTNRIGDSLLILATSWAIISGHWILFFSSYSVASFIIIRLILAAITKRAQLPFSAWLPAAIAAPTPVSALVHSSTLVTAGIYLIIRFYSSLSIFKYFQRFCFFIGVITCFIARIAASLEIDLKKVIALSTLRQLGVIIISLGINQPIIAFFHLVTHALFKALLFICAGNIIHRRWNNQDVRIIGHLSTSIPLTCITLNVANISLCGLPFIAGFYSKDLIIETFLTVNLPYLTSILIILRICLTSIYTIKLSVITLWSPFKGNPQLRITDQRKFISFSYLILLFGAVIRGSFFSWVINPFPVTRVLPFFLKIITLTLILRFGILIYFFSNFKIRPFHWFSTMWFLSFLTSSPINKFSVNTREILNYNELTWIETLSGKGIKQIIIAIKSQKRTDMSFSIILSLILLILISIFFLY